ncbi:unnamed protein product [Caenorhabditis auriculariae]|uniref:Uncharacterized protein n=1 Tax=Caenorhabditis auriculariae TaxID=2777116 RepID=A0A8S1GNF0_9PELO|nr:unnamed protein product [Caenorhabditis auriculariae]
MNSSFGSPRPSVGILKEQRIVESTQSATLLEKISFEDDFYDKPTSSTPGSLSPAQNSEPLLFDESLQEDLEVLRTFIFNETGKSVIPEAHSSLPYYRKVYRQMLSARDLVQEAWKIQYRRFHWMRKVYELNIMDLRNLESLRTKVVHQLKELRSKKIFQLLNITHSTQRPVNVLIEMHAEDIYSGLSDGDESGEFQKFSEISLLCSKALPSLDVLIQKTKELTARRITLQKNQRASRRSRADSSRADDLTNKLKSLSLHDLRHLCKQIKEREL